MSGYNPYVDENLFGAPRKSGGLRTGPGGHAPGEVSVVSGHDLMCIQANMSNKNGPNSSLRKERTDLHEVSRGRVKNWGNTLEALRRKKENARLDKLKEMEEERKKIDSEEALIQAEQRRQAIERANKMLYDDTDRVKSFHSSLLLSDVLKEREAQLDYHRKKDIFEKDQAEAWDRMEAEQIKLAEEEEDRKVEKQRAKAMQVTKMQLDQLEEVKQRYRKKRAEDKREGEMIKKKVVEDLKLEKAAQQARKERATEINMETMRLNKELEELRKEEAKREALEEARIKQFAEEKERMLADRRSREEERFRAKQELRQRMIDAQVKKLGEMKAAEAERLDRQIAEAEAKSTELARLKEEKRQKDLEAMDRSRQFQLKLKSDIKSAHSAEDAEFQRQWKLRYKQIQEEEADEMKRVWLRNKAVQNYIRKQADEKRRKNDYGQRMDLAEAEQAKMLIQEEDLMFEEYAAACMREWESQGKTLKPMIIEVRRKEKLLAAK